MQQRHKITRHNSNNEGQMSDSLYLTELLLRKRATLSHLNSFFRLRTAYKHQQKSWEKLSQSTYKRMHSENQQASIPERPDLVL